jgi:apolipoprotein D and lipocalin family protein
VVAAIANRFRWLACALALAGVCAHAAGPPVRSVGQVDLARYVGKWYEIAAFPMYFQRQCIGDTTAEYALRSDGDIAVVNRCRTEDGFDEAVGRAWVVDGSGNARLKVSFFWPFRADYWILGLDDDYRWAVVGNPNRKYLWVLARTPRLPQDQLDRALEAAAQQGFDLEALKYTPHGDARASPAPTTR